MSLPTSFPRFATRALVPLAALLMLAGAAEAWTDDFEDEANGAPPSGPYTYTGGGFVTNVVANSGTQSFNTAATGGPAGRFDGGSSYCSGPTLSFAFRLNALPAAGKSVAMGAGTSTGPPVFGINVVTSGGVTAYNPSTSLAFTQVITANTWHTVSISNVECDLPYAANTLVASGAFITLDAETLNPKGGSSWVSGPVADISRFVQTSVSPCACVLYIDGIDSADPASYEGPATLTPSGGVRGIDVNPFAGVLIVRSGATDTITTYDPIDFGERATEASGCSTSRQKGVMAHQSPQGRVNVGYLTCEDDAATIDRLKIRSDTLTDPDQSGTGCELDDFCDFFLEADTTLGVGCPGNSYTGQFQANAKQIASVEAIAIDYRNSAQTDNPFVANKAAVGFAYYNPVSGQAGIFVDVMIDDDDDVSCQIEMPLSSPLTEAQICAWRESSTQRDFIAGASATGGSRIWQATFQPHLDAAFTQAPEINVQLHRQLGNTWSALAGVGCAENAVIVATMTGDVYRLNVTGPITTKVWGPIQTTNMPDSAVTVSGDGLWFAYATGTTIEIGDFTTGEITKVIPRPAGTHLNILMDRTGQNVWYATTTTVDRFEVHPWTTEDAVSVDASCTINDVTVACTEANCADPDAVCSNVNPDGTPFVPLPPPGAASAGGGLPGVNSAALGLALGITTEAAGWIIALLLISAVAFGFWQINRTAGVIGAIVGIGMATAFGYLPIWVVAFLALAGAAIVVLPRIGKGSAS